MTEKEKQEEKEGQVVLNNNDIYNLNEVRFRHLEEKIGLMHSHLLEGIKRIDAIGNIVFETLNIVKKKSEVIRKVKKIKKKALKKVLKKSNVEAKIDGE